jgi:hypothetical protein
MQFRKVNVASGAAAVAVIATSSANAVVIKTAASDVTTPSNSTTPFPVVNMILPIEETQSTLRPDGHVNRTAPYAFIGDGSAYGKDSSNPKLFQGADTTNSDAKVAKVQFWDGTHHLVVDNDFCAQFTHQNDCSRHQSDCTWENDTCQEKRKQCRTGLSGISAHLPNGNTYQGPQIVYKPTLKSVASSPATPSRGFSTEGNPKGNPLKDICEDGKHPDMFKYCTKVPESGSKLNWRRSENSPSGSDFSDGYAWAQASGALMYDPVMGNGYNGIQAGVSMVVDTKDSTNSDEDCQTAVLNTGYAGKGIRPAGAAWFQVQGADKNTIHGTAGVSWLAAGDSKKGFTWAADSWGTATATLVDASEPEPQVKMVVAGGGCSGLDGRTVQVQDIYLCAVLPRETTDGKMVYTTAKWSYTPTGGKFSKTEASCIKVSMCGNDTPQEMLASFNKDNNAYNYVFLSPVSAQAN